MDRRAKAPPPPRRELIRLGIILIGVAAGFFVLFRFQHDDIGGAARLALGTWLSTLGTVDLVWLATGDLDRIFLQTRKGSAIAAGGYLVAGLALVVSGVLGIS